MSVSQSDDILVTSLQSLIFVFFDLFIPGAALGTVLGLPITGFISASSSLGWPGIFRFYSLLSGIIGVVVWCYAADTPAKHSKISAAERKYIEDELGQKSEDAEVIQFSINYCEII